MFKKSIPLLLIAIVIYACSSTSSSEDPTTPINSFDRGTLLTYTADNIIIPAFENFNTQLVDLKAKATTFTTTPNATNLTSLQTSWLTAYKAWQYVAMFNLGKAADFGSETSTGGIDFSAHFNVYPVTVADIENNITSGNYSLDAIANYDAQGFPALDYLLYGVGTDTTAILEKYTTHVNATNYKKYITDIIDKMIDVTTQIVNDWNDNFRATFIASTGNTTTSSFNILINDFIYNYEKKFRANKIGTPVGVFSSAALPEKVESYYNRTVSKELALEALTAIERVFNGTNFTGTGSGSSFKTYLEELGRNDIVTEINGQLTTARTQINGLNNNFYQQIIDDENAVLTAYEEIQKVVPLLKVDVLQAFNVSLDYTDADGD